MISLFEAKQAAKKSTEMKERERPLHAESGALSTPDCRPSLISFIHLSQTAINKIQRKIYMREAMCGWLKVVWVLHPRRA
jgi:hypothetical protein